MAKFKVGDRVRVVGLCDGINLNGMTGTVKLIRDSKYTPMGVEFDKKFYVGHDFLGRGKYGHCRWCEESSLELIKDETIVIYRKGNKVIALDKSTGKKAVAKCSPDDEFNFKTGAKLAFERLTRNVTFRLLCIKDDKFLGSCKGKIYEFVDGVTTWDDGGSSNEYKSFDDFKARNVMVHTYFVELKEGDDPAEILKKYDNNIKVGDKVKVVNSGMSYTTYNSWIGLRGYESHYVMEKRPVGSKTYIVLNVVEHELLKGRQLALIQDVDTTQVFIINVKGLIKC